VGLPVATRVATALRLRAHDALDRVSGRHDPLIPPRRLQFVGAGDFAAVGDEFLGHLVELAGLTPGSAVLDVGCGIGRVARPLAGFLDATGSYAGFDVDPRGIAWCRERYPADRFSFTLADLHNLRYNPAGTQRASAYRFPYADGRFDVALMTSVVTHLQEAEAAHYLAEAMRVLRPGGRLLATFFLLDDDSRAALRAGRTSVSFQHPDEEVAVADPTLPEEAVAYDVAWVRERLDVRSTDPGTWRGIASPPGRSYQDIVIACA
jgi:SAM-dependent methyltransferase